MSNLTVNMSNKYRLATRTEIQPDKKYEKVIYRKHTSGYKKEFCVYFCDTCNRAWEIDTSVKSSVVVLHYLYFPKLGIGRKKCYDCKADKKKNK